MKNTEITLSANLTKMFKPQSIAVIGVSLSNPFNPANVVYNKNRHRFSAKTFGVNPKGGSIYGQKVYPSISEIPEKIALAVISIICTMGLLIGRGYDVHIMSSMIAIFLMYNLEDGDSGGGF